MDMTDCAFCGGTHFGSIRCPFQCEKCGKDIRLGASGFGVYEPCTCPPIVHVTDVVMLKSGGPEMVVMSVTEDKATARWGEGLEQQQDVFTIACLKLVRKGSMVLPAPVRWNCPKTGCGYTWFQMGESKVKLFCPIDGSQLIKDQPEQSPLDRATIYLWQREDSGTIGEQGNHIAHVTFKMCQHVSRCMDGLDDPGDPKILTFGAWDTKALEKVMRKLAENQIPFHEWKDPDHVHKGVIAVSTEPLACSTDESGRFEKHNPELFANYKLWPTVNVPQLLEKHLPNTETVVIHSECTATDCMGGHTEPTPVDEGLVPYISGPRARAAVMEILKDLHLVRRNG